MHASLKKLGIAGAALLAAACSSDEGGNAPGAPQGAIGGFPQVVPPSSQETAGCSTAPACGTCAGAFEKCFCYRQDAVACSNETSVTGAGGGAATGAGGYPPFTGAGGAPSAAGGAPYGAGGTDTGGAPSGAGGAGDPGAGGDTGAGGAPVLPPGTQEFQFTSTSFTLPPGGETYKCQNFRNGIGKDAAIVVSESFMAHGSHHMFVFHGPAYNADGPLTDCSGVEFHDYIHVAQVPQTTMSYPPGIGRSLKAGEGLRILAHYYNPGSQALTAQVTIKLHYVDPGAVQFLAAQMFLNQAVLSVAPGKSTKTRTFRVPYDIGMLQAVSHMHRTGVHFSATTSTGQVIYDGHDWDEPVDNFFNPAMPIASGSTITWSCDFENDTGLTRTFGESAASNEMCILNAVFYPTTPGQNQGVPLDSNF